jgi:acyl carrier protein
VAAEGVRALNSRYGTNITVTRVYDHPNLIEFAVFLEAALAKREASTLPGGTGVGEASSERAAAMVPAAERRLGPGTISAPVVADPVERLPVANGEAAPESSVSDEVLREALATSLAEALFLEREEVALDKPFMDMGLDSIVAAEWVRALNSRYGTNITVTKVYDHPNILAFAAFLERQLGAQAPPPVAERLSLDDVLQRVQQGQLDIAQAYQLLQQINAS